MLYLFVCRAPVKDLVTKEDETVYVEPFDVNNAISLHSIFHYYITVVIKFINDPN